MPFRLPPSSGVPGIPDHVADDTALDAETAGTGKVIVKDDDGEMFIMDSPSRSGLVRFNSPAFPSEGFLGQLLWNFGGVNTYEGNFASIGLERINVEAMLTFMSGRSIAWDFSANSFTTSNLDEFFSELRTRVASNAMDWAGTSWDFNGNEEPTPTAAVNLSGVGFFLYARTSESVYTNIDDYQYTLEKNAGDWSLLYQGSVIETASGDTTHPWDAAWSTNSVSKEVNKDVYALRNTYGLTVNVTT